MACTKVADIRTNISAVGAQVADVHADVAAVEPDVAGRSPSGDSVADVVAPDGHALVQSELRGRRGSSRGGRSESQKQGHAEAQGSSVSHCFLP